MKNDSLVRFCYLPLLRLAVAVCAAVCVNQTQAAPPRQIQIETRFVQVSDNYLRDIGVDLSFGNKYPAFGNPLTPQFRPVAVMPEIDVSRVIKLIEKGGQSHVLTEPAVTAKPNEGTVIHGANGIDLRLTPTVNDSGFININIKPEETLVPPGNTLVVGRTAPGGKGDQIVFLRPQLISGLVPARSGEAVGPQMEQAVVPPTINWTGFYMGFQVGYARSQSDYSLKLGGAWEFFPDEAEAIEEEGAHEFDEDGFGIGGCAGYNYEFQNHVVIGIGIAGRKYWKLSDEFETGDFPVMRSEFDVWSSFNTTGLVTVGPKVGYAVGRFLPYVSGGLAFGELDASQKIFSNNFGGFHEGEKESENRLGWNVSAGVQYALTNNWSLRVEYSYSDLGELKYPGRSEPVPTFRDFSSWHMATLTEHAGNFGIVYTFH